MVIAVYLIQNVFAWRMINAQKDFLKYVALLQHFRMTIIQNIGEENVLRIRHEGADTG